MVVELGDEAKEVGMNIDRLHGGFLVHRTTL